jgi:hypothetical protein
MGNLFLFFLLLISLLLDTLSPIRTNTSQQIESSPIQNLPINVYQHNLQFWNVVSAHLSILDQIYSTISQDSIPNQNFLIRHRFLVSFEARRNKFFNIMRRKLRGYSFYINIR